jgi:hypothetical protein
MIEFGLILGNKTPTVLLVIAPSRTILLGTSGICSDLMDDLPNIQCYRLLWSTGTTRINYLVKGMFA